MARLKKGSLEWLFDDIRKDRDASIAHAEEMGRLNFWQGFGVGLLSGILGGIFLAIIFVIVKAS